MNNNYYLDVAYIAGLFDGEGCVTYKKYKEKGIRQAHKSKTNFSFAKMVEQLKDHLDKYVPEIPMEVPLQLPKLDLPKLNLPKLKK